MLAGIMTPNPFPVRRLALSLALLLFAGIAAPLAAMERLVMLKGEALVEIDFLAPEAAARESGGTMEDYYREVAGLIAAHGGELVGVFRVYGVSNGLLRPDGVGIVQWPDAASFAAFKSAADKNGVGLRTQIWRNFYTLAPAEDGTPDLSFTIDDSKIYEFVTLVPNPAHEQDLAVFAARAMAVAGRDFTRRLLVDLRPAGPGLAGAPSDFRAMSAYVVQWDSEDAINAWTSSDLYRSNVHSHLDPAIDRRELVWTRPTDLPR